MNEKARQRRLSLAGFYKNLRLVELLFRLVMRAQHAPEAKNRRGENGAPGAGDKNPAANTHAELLFHFSLREIKTVECEISRVKRKT